jgi:hypothetical protein
MVEVMRRVRFVLGVIAAVWSVWFEAGSFAAATMPRVSLTSAPAILLPGAVDSNSPVMWD